MESCPHTRSSDQKEVLPSEARSSICAREATGSAQDQDEGLVLTKCGRERSAPRDVEHPLLAECVSGTLSADEAYFS